MAAREHKTVLREEAAALVKESAGRAASRLSFYRFLYGVAPSSGLSGAPPHALAEGFFAGTRIACVYEKEARERPLAWQKLACNLLVVAAEGLPRGGRILLCAKEGGPELEAFGEGAALSPEVEAALSLLLPPGELGARTVQAQFTGLLAAAIGYRPQLAERSPDRFRLLSPALV